MTYYMLFDHAILGVGGMSLIAMIAIYFWFLLENL